MLVNHATISRDQRGDIATDRRTVLVLRVPTAKAVPSFGLSKLDSLLRRLGESEPIGCASCVRCDDEVSGFVHNFLV